MAMAKLALMHETTRSKICNAMLGLMHQTTRSNTQGVPSKLLKITNMPSFARELLAWFKATETAYYRAIDFPHTLRLGGICSYILDSWLYNFCTRCKELPDGNEQWVDDESRSRYERMIQLSTPSLDSESGSTPISAEEAFVSVMGKDRSNPIRCGGSRETRRTWYRTGEGSSSTDYQQQISNIENTLRMEVEELCTEVRRRDSEMDEMRRELE
ncbi:hypothetical protein Taro_051137 [Colocasia esculenta]|uniref:Uncharacterized protein n=1 Tax=Colocasia esculenta TaxID=4460 RepID=A0A843XFZ7_COLES|nr:hypothetical protein [Colocasia esculenta]